MLMLASQSLNPKYTIPNPHPLTTLHPPQMLNTKTLNPTMLHSTCQLQHTQLTQAMPHRVNSLRVNQSLDIRTHLSDIIHHCIKHLTSALNDK